MQCFPSRKKGLKKCLPASFQKHNNTNQFPQHLFSPSFRLFTWLPRVLCHRSPHPIRLNQSQFLPGFPPSLCKSFHFATFLRLQFQTYCRGCFLFLGWYYLCPVIFRTSGGSTFLLSRNHRHGLVFERPARNDVPRPLFVYIP